MTILVAAGPGSSSWAAELRSALAQHLPPSTIDVRTKRDDIVAGDVEIVVMWNVPADELASYANLRAIMLVGAGFDHLDLSALPDVPIVRLIDPAMAADIALYVLCWVIHFQRDFDRFTTAQASRTWQHDLPPRFPRDVTVGVLGAGAIGTVVLATCTAHGFGTIGWSRSDNDRPLLDFFAACDIVIDLVPLSDATRGLVGADALAALGDGVLINVGRGGTVDTNALLAALDNDLRAVVLDVFDDEPLPAQSELWGRPDVMVTPHVAGRSDPVTAAPIIAADIARLLRGQMPDSVIRR